MTISEGEVEGSCPMVLGGSACAQALEAEGSRSLALGAACTCTSLRSRRGNGFGIIIAKPGGVCYRHNLTGPEDGPRATWAEGDHRDGLRIGSCTSVLRAGMAVYPVRIV
jgi:hypothetical protein